MEQTVSDDTCDVMCLDPDRARELRAGALSDELAAAGAARLKSLADPTRLRIAAALHDAGELCVCDLGWVCDSSVALVSHHLKSLYAAGLVQRRRDGRLVMYELDAQAVPLLQLALADSEQVA
jgi:DNA-binding transcriptional ArsR family regulator